MCVCCQELSQPYRRPCGFQIRSIQTGGYACSTYHQSPRFVGSRSASHLLCVVGRRICLPRKDPPPPPKTTSTAQTSFIFAFVSPHEATTTWGTPSLPPPNLNLVGQCHRGTVGPTDGRTSRTCGPVAKLNPAAQHAHDDSGESKRALLIRSTDPPAVIPPHTAHDVWRVVVSPATPASVLPSMSTLEGCLAAAAAAAAAWAC
jgi:hypothetical protein